MGEQQASQQGVAVYMRVSGEDQRRRGTIDNQRPDLDRWLNAQGFKPYGWYEDDAVSGHWVPFSKRPAGRRLLADARAGHVNLVLVWCLDRFGRNAVEILKAVEDLEQAGARLFSYKESFDTRTPPGRLMLGILASVAEFEWESIMERSTAGIERRLGREDGTGWMGGPVPYGYRVEGKEQTARLVPDETPLGLADDPILTYAGVVRLIYALTVEQQQSGTQIAKRLNAMGVPTAFALRGLTRFRRRSPKGDEDKPVLHTWKADKVTHMLSNSTYKGERPFGRRQRHESGREVVTYRVPALVTLAQWDAAQAVLASHQRWNVHNAQATQDYLLRGMLRCAHCGLLYGGAGVSYACMGRRHAARLYGDVYADARRCHGASLSKARIEAAVWAKAEHLIRHCEEAHQSLAARYAGQTDEGAKLRAQLAAKQQESGTQQGQRDTILTYYRTGHMTEADLTHQLDAIAAEQANLADEIAVLTKALTAADDTAAQLADVDAFLTDLEAWYDAEPVTPERQRATLEKIVERMEVRTELNEETGKRRAVVDVHWWFDDPEKSEGQKVDHVRRTARRTGPSIAEGKLRPQYTTLVYCEGQHAQAILYTRDLRDTGYPFRSRKV
jgi:site-specific DNA recombinase